MDFSAFGKTNKTKKAVTKTETKKTSRLDFSAFKKKQAPLKMDEASLNTRFNQNVNRENQESLKRFGLDPNLANTFGQTTPQKMIKLPGGYEAKAESYYGKEGIKTPRSKEYDYEGLAKRDEVKRKNLFGTLKAELDHLAPKALGGTEGESNLKTVKAKTGLFGLLKPFTPTATSEKGEKTLPEKYRQGGTLEFEKKVIDAYNNDELSQVESLLLLKKVKDMRDNKKNPIEEVAMWMASQIAKPKEKPTSEDKEPLKIKVGTANNTQTIGGVIDKPITSDVKVVMPKVNTNLKVNQNINNQGVSVNTLENVKDISSVIGAKPSEYKASVGQSILKAGTSAMIISPVKNILGLSKMFTEQQTQKVKNSKYYPKFIKSFTSKTNDQVNKTLDNWIGKIDEENKSIMSGVYTDDGKYDAQEVASLVTQGVSSLAIAAGTGAISGGTTLPAIIFGGIQASDTYLEARKKGLDTNKATLSAIADGTFTAVTEKIGLDLMFGKYLKGKGLGRRILTTIITETSQELTQQYGSNIIAKLGYDKTRGILDGTLDTIIATIPTAIIGGGFTEVARNQGITQVKKDFANAGVNIDRKDAENIYDKLFENVLKERNNFEEEINKEIEKKQAEAQKIPPQKPPVATQEKITPETTKVSTEPKKTLNIEEKNENGTLTDTIKTIKFSNGEKPTIETWVGDKLYDIILLRDAEKRFGTTDKDLLANRIVNPHEGWNYKTNSYEPKTTQIDPLIQEAKKYKSAEEFVKEKEKDFTNDMLFHGSSEGRFSGDFKKSSHDGITVWTAESPEIAQNYIPKSGSSQSIKIYPDELKKEITPSDTDTIKKLSGAKFKNVEYYKYPTGEDNISSPKSWETVKKATMGDVKNNLKEMGYKPDSDGFYDIIFDNEGNIASPEYSMPSELYIFKGKNKLKLKDIRTSREGDLMDVDYNKFDDIKKAESEGYDGVIINDFAQSKKQGNVGHKSIGLFESGYKKLEKTKIDAKNFDDLSSKEKTPEIKEYVKSQLIDIYNKANQSVEKETPKKEVQSFESWADEMMQEAKKDNDFKDIDKEIEEEIMAEIVNEAKQEANNNLEKDIKSLGGLKPYTDAFMKEELSSIPARIKKTDGIFLDELVGELNGMGYNYEDSNSLLSDLQALEKGAKTKGTKKIKPIKIKEIISTSIKRKNAENKPVKYTTGDIKENSLYKNWKDKLEINLEGETSHNIAVMAEQTARAELFYKENKDIAIEIAYLKELPPEGILYEKIATTVIRNAIKDGDLKLANDIIRILDAKSTRMGQEISALRGEFDEDDTYTLVNQVLRERKNKLLRVEYKKDGTSNVKQNFERGIKEKAKEINKVINKKASAIQSAQDILDSLLC